ncbi:MAG: glycosyltransferase family 4 protein [Chitinophagaceae bacterium]|nr:glycosyltransferase family 4 protein [Chitinophagaceae bacterium]
MTKKIKVLECIRQGQIGGGESHLLSLVENLNRDRFEPVVLSFTEGPMVDRLRALNVNTHVIYTEKPFDVSKWGQVKQLLQAERPALVHAHGTRASSNTLWAARSLGIPLIYTVHGWSFHDDQSLLVRRMRIMGERYITSRSAFNIAVSASNRQSGIDQIPGLKATVISNGIDQKKFSPAKKFKNIREELKIPADAMLVLFVARFTHHKQPLALIRAFREALAGLPSLHLLMVGDGDQKEEGVALVKELGLEDKVTLQPFRQDVPEVLASADIFVLPSLWEGLPIGLLEAMAMGKAVVATRVDGTKEVIQHEVNGLLVEPGDFSALAAALVRLGKDDTLRASLHSKALETIKEQYNAGVMTRKIEAVYDSFVK